MIKNGKGGGNTKTGLIFEGKTDLGTFLSQQAGYKMVEEKEKGMFNSKKTTITIRSVYYNDEKVADLLFQEETIQEITL